MAEQRRDTLKIIGAISATCAFPFSSDELYGQQEHAHAVEDAAKPGLPTKPVFFTATEFETVKRVADLIIPASDTPGAVDAGVPSYIDYVVNSSANWKRVFREGLQWLDADCSRRHGKTFRELTEAQQIAVLTPLSEKADRLMGPSVAVAKGPASAKAPAIPAEVRFFKAFKGMTADGYFTAKAGLVDTLGYKGNTVLTEFPNCG